MDTDAGSRLNTACPAKTATASIPMLTKHVMEMAMVEISEPFNPVHPLAAFWAVMAQGIRILDAFPASEQRSMPVTPCTGK